MNNQLLDVKDVARLLSVSTRAVYRLSDARKLPSVKWGRSLRFRPVDVAKFIDEHTVEAIDFEAEADTILA
jgi:excisionase family DNA binding protein